MNFEAVDSAIPGILLMIFSILGVMFYLESRRKEAVREAGRALGWMLHDTLPAATSFAVTEEVLYPSRGYNRNISLIFEIARSEGSAVLFEYQYVTRSGKNRTTHKFIACFLPCQKQLPHFELRKEGWADKLVQAVGFDDIDLPHSAEFSKKFHLSGEHADAVRTYFTPGLIVGIPELKDSIVTSLGSGVLIRRRYAKLKAETLAATYEELLGIAKLFTARAF